MMRSAALLLVAAALVSTSTIHSITTTSANAFVQHSRPAIRPAMRQEQSWSTLHFGIPTFQPKNDKDGEDQEEKKIGASGFIQLLTAGMGSPFLGEYEGTDEETGKMMFSLEANNLVDEDGNSKQTKMPYFESGWVDEEEERERKEKGFKFPWQK